MGDFAINVAVGHQTGAARGERSILSAMDVRGEELFAAFGQSINHLILSHRKDLERKCQASVGAWRSRERWSKLEVQRRRRMQYIAGLDKTHEEAQRLIRILEKRNRVLTEAFDRA
jgi:hypothetical protein